MHEHWSKISRKTLFKMLFGGYLGIYGSMSILFALLTAFGVEPVYFDGEPYTGLQGVAIVIVYIPLISLILSVTNWVALSAGLWVYSNVVSILGIKNTGGA